MSRTKLVRGGITSLADQGLTSLATLLTAVILGKALSPEDFGTYTVLTTVLLVLFGVSNSLIASPLRILGVTVSDTGAPAYWSSQLMLQAAVATALAVATPLVLFVTGRFDATIAAALSLCVLGTCLQDFTRVAHTSRFRWTRLLVVDIIGYAGRVVVLSLLLLSRSISVASALFAVAIMHLLAVTTVPGGALRVRASTLRIRDAWLGNWTYGKWLLLETAVFTLSTQVYVFLVATWVDLSAAGVLGAVQVLGNCVNVVFVGVMNFAIPIASQKLHRDGYFAWKRWLILVGLGLLGVSVAVCTLLSVFAATLLTILFRDSYADYAYVVAIMSVAMVLQSATTVLSAAFRTAGAPQIGFVQNCVSAVVTSLAAYPMIMRWGVGGAALGLVLTQLSWVAVSAAYIFGKGVLTEARVAARMSARAATPSAAMNLAPGV